MKRYKKYILTSVLFLPLFAEEQPLFAEEQNNAQRPNILVIISDDQNTRLLSCYNGNIKTPGIDRIADEGMLFNRAYSNATLCVPTRYICLTGSYASRSINKNHGPLSNYARIANTPFFTDEDKTIAMALKEAGYYTGATGKWHNASLELEKSMANIPKDADPKDPEIIKQLAEIHEAWSEDIRKYGFDYAEYLLAGNPSLYPTALNYHNVEYTVKGAIDFLEKAPEDKPFFLWTAFTPMHGPQHLIDAVDVRITPAGYTEKHITPPLMPGRSEIIASCDNPNNVSEQMMKWMDAGVNTILEKLDAMGVSENTLVIFLSDQQNIGKSTTHERGQNIAFLVRYPALINGGEVSNTLVDVADMAATILDVADAEPVEGMQIDGLSMVPLWNGTKETLKPVIFSEMGYSKAVVTEDFKYIAIRYPESVLKKGTPPTSGNVTELSQAGELFMLQSNTPWGQSNRIGIMDPDQLYDLRSDPGETINLANNPEYAEKLKEMKMYLSEFLNDIGRPFSDDL